MEQKETKRVIQYKLDESGSNWIITSPLGESSITVTKEVSDIFVLLDLKDEITALGILEKAKQIVMLINHKKREEKLRAEAIKQELARK